MPLSSGGEEEVPVVSAAAAAPPPHAAEGADGRGAALVSAPVGAVAAVVASSGIGAADKPQAAAVEKTAVAAVATTAATTSAPLRPPAVAAVSASVVVAAAASPATTTATPVSTAPAPSPVAAAAAVVVVSASAGGLLLSPHLAQSTPTSGGRPDCPTRRDRHEANFEARALVRQLLHHRFENEGVYDEVRRRVVERAVKLGVVSEEDLLPKARRHRLVDDLVEEMTRKRPPQPSDTHPAGPRYLHVQLLSVGSLLDEVPSVSVHVVLGSQREKGRSHRALDPRYPTSASKGRSGSKSTAFPLCDDFLFDLATETGFDGTGLSVQHFPHLLHIFVSCPSPSSPSVRQTLGAASVDPRQASTGKCRVTVELGASGMTVPVGVVDVSLQFLPPHPPVPYLPRPPGTRSAASEAERDILERAREWGTGGLVYLSEYSRLVPVTMFVEPVAVPGCDTPLHAARMVSLLTTLPAPANLWSSPAAVVANGQGTKWDKACLLCSALLGFAIDSWVAIATDGVPKVLTRSPSILVWDAEKGSHDEPTPDGPMLLFNHRQIHRSMVEDGELVDLGEPFGEDILARYARLVGPSLPLWRKVERCGEGHANRLKPPWKAPQVAEDFECALQAAITCHREERRLPPAMWDGDLAYMMSQALWEYERGKLMGPGKGRRYDAIPVSVVPRGHTLQCFPVHFSHANPARAFDVLLSTSHTRTILELSEPELRLVLRAHVVPYAEDIVSCWVLVGAVYLCGS
eukprot:Sspe_Gene.41746::Locus_20201_Transcript_1_1_Confidence_1.000_Length_2311::g.41746::m.41746/K16457/CEP76; centrosomal protein CEP76